MTTTQAKVKANGYGYDVYLDGVRIGRVWNRPGRSLSGGWSAAHSSGRGVGNFHDTRAEAVEAVVRFERAESA